MHPPVSGWRSRVESPLIHLLWIFIVALFPSGESYPQDSSDIHRVRMKEDSLFASGMMAFGEGRLQSALAAFFTISDTVRPGIHANIAAVQAAMGDVKSAEKEWRRALVLDTSSFRVRLQLADLLDRQGRTEEAEGFYRRALKQDSTFPAALEGLGNLLVRKRAYSEALPILSPGNCRIAPECRALRANGNRPLQNGEGGLCAHNARHQSCAQSVERSRHGATRIAVSGQEGV